MGEVSWIHASEVLHANKSDRYAYGCNELVFNPLHTWIWKSPFTKLFRKFLFSNIQLSSKISICGYIFSYYALGSAVPLGALNYFLVGWLNGDLDKYYVPSWQSKQISPTIHSYADTASLRYIDCCLQFDVKHLFRCHALPNW